MHHPLTSRAETIDNLALLYFNKKNLPVKVIFMKKSSDIKDKKTIFNWLETGEGDVPPVGLDC